MESNWECHGTEDKLSADVWYILGGTSKELVMKSSDSTVWYLLEDIALTNIEDPTVSCLLKDISLQSEWVRYREWLVENVMLVTDSILGLLVI